MTVGRVWAHYEGQSSVQLASRTWCTPLGAWLLSPAFDPAGYDIRAPDAGGDPFPFISLQMEPGLYNETTFQVCDGSSCRPTDGG